MLVYAPWYSMNRAFPKVRVSHVAKLIRLGMLDFGDVLADFGEFYESSDEPPRGAITEDSAE